jgi:phosphatidate phosphatase APP1
VPARRQAVTTRLLNRAGDPTTSLNLVIWSSGYLIIDLVIDLVIDSINESINDQMTK